ncbi:MAG: proline hydroxylase [Okeania sp. SIO2F4]|uniref:2OG-Fe(II) oxygenase n=1 Tax=Okeania sp. SIO2F4 TaxID=2607790 RepID=UPI00142C18FE|nr:2OG-Fe(II) oxygenase [Okeania sp. SIO2F4]NES06177.1 proline hydroxylase [Okeania sp. SIO2F4]
MANINTQKTQLNIKTNPAPTPQTEILESHYLLRENFLSHSENQQLLNYALQKKSDFLPTIVSNYSTTNRLNIDENQHCPLVLQFFPQFEELIVKKIQEILPDVLAKLNVSEFSIAKFENRLTAYNDRNFYRVHIDNKHPGIDTRVITYVYYCYQEPKAFTGGNLRIYDSKIQGKYYSKADTFKTIEPENNSIVFFLSSYLHEVLPISCPSQGFADSRFTVNGWIHCTN